MKTQILSRPRRIASVSIIGFLLLVTTTLIGCGVLFNVNRVMRLDPVILKEYDLPMMQARWSRRIGTPTEDSSLIVGFQQHWSGDLTVEYWLFDAAYTAQKAAADVGAFRMVAAVMNYQPERNPEDVIGDATWRYIPRLPRRSWDNATAIVFVKNNVMVHVMVEGHSVYQLQFIRDVARRIEAKIETVLPKNKTRIL